MENKGMSLDVVLMIHELQPVALKTDKLISADNVPKWQNFRNQDARINKPGWLRGFRHEDRCWSNLEQYFYALDELKVEETEEWEGDLQDIAGIASHPNAPEGIHTLEQYAIERGLVKTVSEEALKAALADVSLNRLMSGNAALAFFGWDGRIFLDDLEALDKLAEAQYIAKKLGKAVPLKATVTSQHISYKAMRGLREDFELRVITPSLAFEHNFFLAMRNLEAPYFVAKLPAPLNGSVYLLPKTSRKSVEVATQMKNNCVADLGKYLEDLSCNQTFATND